MAPNLTQVMVGEAQLYYAPFGEATPGQGEPMPADTVALGTSWGGNWVAIGGTLEGVKLSKNPKTVDIRIEEQSPPADVVIDTQDISVMTTLSEEAVTNMKLAYGGGVITTQAPTTSLIGKSTLVLSDVLDLLSVGFEGINPEGFWVRAYIPKVVSAAQVDTSFRRAAQQRLWPVTLRAICPVSQIQVVEMTAAHT